jgi:aminomethyltransferase
MAYNHMYMPMDYGRAPGVDYAALTGGVTVWDVGAERQVELHGPDAIALANRLVTRDLAGLVAGDCRYTLVTDEAGTVICDPVLLCVDADRVWLSHGNVDLLLWCKGIAHGAGLDVAVGEADVPPIQVQGPRSPELLAAAGVDVDGLAWYHLRHARVDGVDCVVSRTGWSGERGYEIFPLGSAGALGVWDALVAAGEPLDVLVTAPNVQRALERGITDTAWFHNLGANALEVAPRVVHLDAGDFVGRDALRAIRDRGVARATVGLLGPDVVPGRVEGAWSIAAAEQVVGATRWVTRSPALGRLIAVALVEVAHAGVGTGLTLRAPAGPIPVTAAALPFVPPPAGART